MFNALDLMENKTFLEKLKFGIGDGNLQYYLYNWRCPGTDSEKVSEHDTAIHADCCQDKGALSVSTVGNSCVREGQRERGIVNGLN